MASQNLVSIRSGNGLLPDSTKPLPEPMLLGHNVLGMMKICLGCLNARLHFPK